MQISDVILSVRFCCDLADRAWQRLIQCRGEVHASGGWLTSTFDMNGEMRQGRQITGVSTIVAMRWTSRNSWKLDLVNGMEIPLEATRILTRLPVFTVLRILRKLLLERLEFEEEFFDSASEQTLYLRVSISCCVTYY